MSDEKAAALEAATGEVRPVWVRKTPLGREPWGVQWRAESADGKHIWRVRYLAALPWLRGRIIERVPGLPEKRWAYEPNDAERAAADALWSWHERHGSPPRPADWWPPVEDHDEP